MSKKRSAREQLRLIVEMAEFDLRTRGEPLYDLLRQVVESDNEVQCVAALMKLNKLLNAGKLLNGEEQ